jgi:hypothetical protein
MLEEKQLIPDMDKMNWNTIETEVRKLVMEVVSPYIRQSKISELIALSHLIHLDSEQKVDLADYGKMLLENKSRLDALEVAVFNSDKKETAFDSINSSLESKNFLTNYQT